ncbi:hypothetical protein ACFLQL_01550 [Verrucomicrobiota bacterium]
METKEIPNTPISSSEADTILNSPEFATAIKNTHRADLLPLMFKLSGKEYSLHDYPQFREMYSAECAPDSIWLCGRQTSKSMNLSRSEIMNLMQIPFFQILYIAPLKPQAIRYSSLYLREAISSCDLAQTFQTNLSEEIDSNITQNVLHQTFNNGSGIQLTYAKTSSDRARGIFADMIDFDEVQDQLVDNLPIVTQSLTQSKWGLRRFTGTAKTVDNTIESLWQLSSQDEWVIKCDCGYWNVPTMEGKVLEMIQFDGPHCIKCNRLLNVRNGGFVSKYKDRIGTFRGRHVPQVVVPAIVEDPVKWQRLVRKVLNSDLTTVMQEILGISCNVGSRLISQEDIDKNSVLPSTNKLKDHLNDYIFTVGGVDWGVAEHTSFTVHTIVGIKPDGKIHVLWAKRFAGFDPDTVLQEIAKAHTFYKCDLICCDFGMGFDKNVMLIKRFDLPVIQINYTMQNQLFNLNPILGYPRWVIDKVSALDMLFLGIKYNNILFPPKDEFDVYTQDLLSPYEDVTEIGGISRRKYLRNPSRPDDFCHALCYACLGSMKLAGHTALEMVPDNVMNTNTIDSGDLVKDNIDPSEILLSNINR